MTQKVSKSTKVNRHSRLLFKDFKNGKSRKDKDPMEPYSLVQAFVAQNAIQDKSTSSAEFDFLVRERLQSQKRITAAQPNPLAMESLNQTALESKFLSKEFSSESLSSSTTQESETEVQSSSFVPGQGPEERGVQVSHPEDPILPNRVQAPLQRVSNERQHRVSQNAFNQSVKQRLPRQSMANNVQRASSQHPAVLFTCPTPCCCCPVPQPRESSGVVLLIVFLFMFFMWLWAKICNCSNDPTFNCPQSFFELNSISSDASSVL